MHLNNLLKVLLSVMFVFSFAIPTSWAGIEDRKGVVEFQITINNVTAFSGSIKCSAYIDAEWRQLNSEFVSEQAQKSAVVGFTTSTKSQICKITLPFNWKGVDPSKKMRGSVYVYDYSCQCGLDKIRIYPDLPNFDFPIQMGKKVIFMTVDI